MNHDPDSPGPRSLSQVTTTAAIAGSGVMATPGLVVDDRVLVSGRVPQPAEIRELLTAASSS